MRERRSGAIGVAQRRRAERRSETREEEKRRKESVRANPQRTVRFPSQRTQQAAVCRAKSMRGGDRELSPLALPLPSWFTILFHLQPCRDQPSSLVPSPLSVFLLSFCRSFAPSCSTSDVQTRPSVLTLASTYHRIRAFTFTFTSAFTNTLQRAQPTPGGLISCIIFITAERG